MSFARAGWSRWTRGRDPGVTLPDPLPVTTVVISRDRRSDLLATLTRHPGPVIYLDNGSRDGSPRAVRAALPHVRVVELGRNHGAPARGIGVELARTPYVAFADDDSWWAPGALEQAAALMDASPRLALVAARTLVGPQQEEDPVCRVMRNSPLPDEDDLPGKPVLGFLACAAVVRRDAFLAAGGFDPVVFFAGEEERLALDLATAGLGLSYVEEIVAHHHPSVVRGDPSARQARQERGALLTALMRRPAPVVRERFSVALRDAGPARRGALAAAAASGPALRRRRVVPPELERRIQLLEDAPFGEVAGV